MPKKLPFRGIIDAKIDDLFLKVAKGGRTINLNAANDLLGPWLIDNLPILVAHVPQIGRQMIERRERARRPNIDGSYQRGLFWPTALVPTGPNERVFMEMATREDVIAWKDIRVGTYDDFSGSQDYFMDWFRLHMDSWTADYPSLADLEAGAFGWLRPYAVFDAPTDTDTDTEPPPPQAGLFDGPYV
jgi:hypothetical protein